jgi:hypothetical protein
MNLKSAGAKRIPSKSEALKASVNLVSEISDPMPEMDAEITPLQVAVNLVHPPQRRWELRRVFQVGRRDHELNIKPTKYRQSHQLLDLQESGSQLAVVDEKSVGGIVPLLVKSS